VKAQPQAGPPPPDDRRRLQAVARVAELLATAETDDGSLSGIARVTFSFDDGLSVNVLRRGPTNGSKTVTFTTADVDALVGS